MLTSVLGVCDALQREASPRPCWVETQHFETTSSTTCSWGLTLVCLVCLFPGSPNFPQVFSFWRVAQHSQSRCTQGAFFPRHSLHPFSCVWLITLPFWALLSLEPAAHYVPAVWKKIVSGSWIQIRQTWMWQALLRRIHGQHCSWYTQFFPVQMLLSDV